MGPRRLGFRLNFCDPYASWQTGGGENSNGHLPRDLPRKTDLQALTQKKFDETILTHTLKPKKCLHWTTFSRFFINI
jgi:IS30 family transposase